MATEKKLIPANKDRNYMIKESDKDYFHVHCTRITILPNDPLHPRRESFVQIFDVATWLRFQKMKEGKNPVDWQKAALIAEARVLHDPRIVTKNQ